MSYKIQFAVKGVPIGKFRVSIGMRARDPARVNSASSISRYILVNGVERDGLIPVLV